MPMATAHPTKFYQVCCNVATPTQDQMMRSVMTLAIGALGAGLALQLSVPLFMITGPALAVALAGYARLPVMIAPLMRNIIFVVTGVILGAQIDSTATAALVTWPIVFVALAMMLLTLVPISSVMLMRLFGFDRTGAVLASTPSIFTRRISKDYPDRERIALVQSVRMLVLALAMPVLAALFGIHVDLAALQPTVNMGIVSFSILSFISVFVGLVLNRLKIPGALLISGMMVAILAQLAGFVKGAPSADITLLGYIAIGTLLGSRLAKIRRKQIGSGLWAGLATSALALTASIGFAVAAGAITGLPVLHIIAGLAPGGLETMVTIGAVMGANAGFIAACHVVRIFVLMAAVPLMLHRKQGKSDAV
jgi:membrane AbrB-like protein